MPIIFEIPAYLGGRRRAKTDRELARDAGADAGFWGRQCLGNINLGLDVEAVRKAARNAAHHYRRREKLLGRGEEEAPMVNAQPFDARTARAARRSWQEATPEELAAMLRKDLELYREERAARSILAVYLGNLRELVESEGGAAPPAGLLANQAVTRVAGILGAIACATETGGPRVLVDGNSVSFYDLELNSGDDVVHHTAPMVDPLLEELAAALGCAWRWVEDEAIELVTADEAAMDAVDAAEHEASERLGF